MFDRAPVPIAVARRGHYLRVNAAYARLFGYPTPEGMVGLPFTAEVAEEVRDLLRYRNEERERGAAVPRSYEFQAVRRDGSRFPARVEVDVLPFSKGPVTVAFFTDLSEAEQIEQERRARLRHLEGMHRISQLLDGDLETEQVLDAVLGELLGLFDCQRALLLPTSDAAVPGLPRLFQAARAGCPVPADALDRVCDYARSSSDHLGETVALGAEQLEALGLRRPPWAVAAQLGRVVRTRRGQPWLLLVQCCAEERSWGPADVLLFQDIAARVADTLGNVILLHELKESRTQFWRVVEAIPQGVWVARGDGTIEYINERWLRHAGVTMEEARQGGWVEGFHPDDRELTVARWTHAIATGTTFEVEHRVRNAADGSYGWFLSRAYPVRDAEGRVINWFGTATAIDDQKRVAEELASAKRNLEAIIGNINDGLAVHDLSGRILFANDAAARNYGLPNAQAFMTASREELFARVTLLDEDGRPLAQEETPYYIARTQRVSSQRLVQMRRSFCSEPLWAIVRSTPVLDPSGEVSQVVSSAHDVTELMKTQRTLRESEEQLRHAQKMEAIGRLAGGVAHDFNNLLTVINAYAELALASVDEGAVLAEYLRDVRNAGERAASLTAQLLAFSRKQVVEAQLLDVNEVVTSLSRLLRRLIREDIDLVLKLDPNIGVLRANRGQIEQVLMNLVVNARDAMPRGGCLTIETADVPAFARSAPGRPPERQLLLQVRDTGHGISPELQERIFEPFFTTKPAGEGTGLGLASAYGIVAQNGGTITVESAPGRGACFRILLPVLSETARERPRGASAERAPVTRRDTILIVEDEHSVRRLMRRVLESRGYDVIDASNGPEALAKLDAGLEVQLVVTDMVMPEMSGPDLAQRISERGLRVPILFTSGYTGGLGWERALAGERRSFLQKPFSPDQLGNQVRELLERERTSTASSSS